MPDAAGDGSVAELRGEGFVLRRWRSDDLEALLRHADDAQVERGLGDRFPHPYTRADGEAFLAGSVVDLRHPVFAIEVDGEACGGIGVRPLEGERRIGACSACRRPCPTSTSLRPGCCRRTASSRRA